MAEVIKTTTDTTEPIGHTVSRIRDMAKVTTVMALATRTSLRTVTETCMAIKATTMNTVIQCTKKQYTRSYTLYGVVCYTGFDNAW